MLPNTLQKNCELRGVVVKVLVNVDEGVEVTVEDMLVDVAVVLTVDVIVVVLDDVAVVVGVVGGHVPHNAGHVACTYSALAP